MARVRGNRYYIAAGVVAVAVAAGVAYWLPGGSSGRTYRTAEPALTGQAGRLAKRYQSTGGPRSTSAPTGAGLGAPDGLTGTPGQFHVLLSWRPVSGATGYLVYRDGRKIGQTTGLIFDDTGARAGAKHSWTVAGVAAGGRPGDPSAPYAGAAVTP